MIRKPRNQAEKSLRDFAGRLLGVILGRVGRPVQMPRPRLVVRVGAVGHLHVDAEASISFALGALLAALREYAERANPKFHQLLYGLSATEEPTPPELRLICQLAPGFDRLAATVALQMGFRIHAVLPGSRTACEHEMQRWGNLVGRPGDPPSPHPPNNDLPSFRDLMNAADRVLELDRDDAASELADFTPGDYAQAGSVLLQHTDLLSVAIHEEASDRLGGTRWIEQRADELDLPILRLPIERPSDALLIWTEDGRRESRRLFNAMFEGVNPRVFEAPLDEILFGPTLEVAKKRTGWLEDRMACQLDSSVNAAWWDHRWTLPKSSNSLAEHSLGSVPAAIDADLRAVKVWADHRASAMAELVRGSFIFCALVGTLAVFGALTGLLVHSFGTGGKVLELVSLMTIVWFIRRSRKMNWRSQWLSIRQVERCVDQAAWLLLLGRLRTYTSPAHLKQFQLDETSLWASCYLRAALRSSSFPNGRLDADYVRTVHDLALHNLVQDQLSFYESEAAFNYRADELLESYTLRCFVVAFGAALFYVVTPYLLRVVESTGGVAVSSSQMETAIHLLKSTGPAVTVIGALMPAIGAALSAIRNHGEYAQIAARFRGIHGSLRVAENELTRLLPNRRGMRTQSTMRSSILADILQSTTDALFQEVVGWRAILQNKIIELP